MRPVGVAVRSSVRRELERVASARAPWVVADMDSTLIRKDPGVWPDLEESPVRPNLLRWLKLGGRLLVVTSDEGHRPFRQFLAQIHPAELRESVLLSVGDGASIYMPERSTESNKSKGAEDSTQKSTSKIDMDFVIDQTYIDRFTPYLPHPEETMGVACKMAQDFLIACSKDPSLLDTVKPESRRNSYRELIAQFTHSGSFQPQDLRAHMTPDMCTTRGTLPGGYRGTVIWRNYVRPKGPPGWKEGKPRSKSEGKRSDQPITTLWCMGIRKEISEQFVAPVRDHLADLGVSVGRGPNSIFFSNARTDKGMAIKYLVEKGSLSLNSALAFGDNPSGNDFPLTKFVSEGMPFISVAKTIEDTPEHVQNWFVGGLETGTAKCLEIMCEVRESVMNAGGVAGQSAEHDNISAGGSNSESEARL